MGNRAAQHRSAASRWSIHSPSSGRTGRHQLRRRLLLVAVAAVLLAGCGSDPEPAQEPAQATEASAPAVTPEAEDALDRAQRLDLLGRLPEAGELAARIPPRHGVWMAVSVDIDPLIVPLSPGVRVTEQVVVDERAALLRPLVEHEQRPRELLVLTLSERQADLAVLDLTSRALEPVGDPFPFVFPGDHSATKDRSSTRQARERRRHHWSRVADAAHRIIEARDLPVVTVGVERNQSFLREVSAWAEELAVAVVAAPDQVHEPDLVDLVVAAADEHRLRRIEEVRSLLDARQGGGRVATGMTDLFAAALAGRIDTLVLVDGPPVEGYLTPSGHLVAQDPGDGEHVADVYALGMAEVVRRGGRVLLAPEGTLETSTAILRW